MNIHKTVSYGLTLAGFGALVAGCGGASAPNLNGPQGQVAVNVVFAPAVTRAVNGSPLGAKAIKVSLTDNTGVSLSLPQTIPAPAPGATSNFLFTNVPVGLVKLEVGVYPDIATAQPAMALGTGSGNVTAGPPTTIPVVVNLTLQSLRITQVGATTILPGATAPSATIPIGINTPITVSELDAAGHVLTGFPIVWSSSNALVAPVQGDTTNPLIGHATPNALGSAVIEAREVNTGITTDVTLNVTGP